MVKATLESWLGRAATGKKHERTRRRVVYAYDMIVNGKKISTSLATFELVPADGKTLVVLTEQGAFYEDSDTVKYAPEGAAASRREGTKGLMAQFEALFA
jgi:hypothetical protein